MSNMTPAEVLAWIDDTIKCDILDGYSERVVQEGRRARTAVAALIARVEELEAKRNALMDDAERIDWLEYQAKSSRTGASFDWCRHVEDGYVTEKGFRFMRHHYLGQRKDTLRAAIDAARAEAGSHG